MDTGIDEISFSDGIKQNEDNPSKKISKIHARVVSLQNQQLKLATFKEIVDKTQEIESKSNANSNSNSNPDIDIYVLASGGDGTVIWVIQELIFHNPVYKNLAVGMLPLGTGNDFSIATGFWGKILYY